jgi:hypothetical protein
MRRGSKKYQRRAHVCPIDLVLDVHLEDWDVVRLGDSY